MTRSISSAISAPIALRFSLIALTATGQDVYISKEKFELGRNFGTKIWNAARFMQMHTGDQSVDVTDPQFDPELLTADDQHICRCCTRLSRPVMKTSSGVDSMIMPRRFTSFSGMNSVPGMSNMPSSLNGSDEARKAEVLRVMHYVLSRALCLLHPIMPFLTEELWQGMGYAAMAESVMIAPGPKPWMKMSWRPGACSPKTWPMVNAKHAAIGLARTLRADYGLSSSQTADFVLRPADAATATGSGRIAWPTCRI